MCIVDLLNRIDVADQPYKAASVAKFEELRGHVRDFMAVTPSTGTEGRTIAKVERSRDLLSEAS